MEVGEYMFFHSGNEEKYYRMGFIVTNKLKHTIIDFGPISDRMCRIRIRGRYQKIQILNVPAPTEVKDETKNQVYELLERKLKQLSTYDIKIILGNMNAQVGKEQIYKWLTGRNGMHELGNDNGKRLVEFTTENKMNVMSTHFQHKKIYQVTWRSPDGQTENQIDHVLVEKKHAKFVKGVRSYRDADADTDYFLIKTKIVQEVPIIRKNKHDEIPRYQKEEREDRNADTFQW